MAQGTFSPFSRGTYYRAVPNWKFSKKKDPRPFEKGRPQNLFFPLARWQSLGTCAERMTKGYVASLHQGTGSIPLGNLHPLPLDCVLAYKKAAETVCKNHVYKDANIQGTKDFKRHKHSLAHLKAKIEYRAYEGH